MRTQRLLSLAVGAATALTCLAEVRFPRPNVIPEPVSLGYRESQLCRLDDRATVRVACDDPSARDWVERQLRDLLKVSPRVTGAACAETNGTKGAYRLRAEPAGVFTLSAKDPEGVRNAFYTLRMCLMSERGVAETAAWIAPGLDVVDAPAHGFRAMHVCWMPETRLMTVERQIRLAAYFKFNYLVLEFWGTYDSAAYPWFGWREHKVPTAELRRLVALGRDLGVTLVPALNCFGHASMARRGGGKHVVLDLDPRRQALFEPREGWVWCLTNPETQKTIRTLLSEMYETFGRPGYFHIGCDESDPPSCPVCAATDWTKTVADHVRGLRDHVASLGARTLMWHDMLVSRKDPRWQDKAFARYPVNGASKEECERLLTLLPKDVVICDWYYNAPLADYPTWAYFKSFGFDVVPCSWQNMSGTKSMGIAALAKGTFGFMGTTWHHAYNEDLYCCYLGAAEAAWGSSGRVRMDACDFATRWRQVGWDMKIRDKADCGYAEDEIPRHTATPH